MLLLTLLILIVSVTVFVIFLINPIKIRNEQLNASRNAMAEYRENLVAFAFGSANGQLPCPDTSTNGFYEGSEDNNGCNEQEEVELGRIPWRSIELPPLKDAQSECFWYAVTGTHKKKFDNNQPNLMFNEDTPGMLRIINKEGNIVWGDQAYNRPVAAIIAPGGTLSQKAQDRSDDNMGQHSVVYCGGNYNAGNYLEVYDVPGYGTINNADEDSSSAGMIHDLVQGNLFDADVNDTILPVSRRDIFEPIMKSSSFKTDINNLALKLAECLAGYARISTSNELPWATPIDLTDYEDETAYEGIDGVKFGRLPYSVRSSVDTTWVYVDNLLNRGIYTEPPVINASAPAIAIDSTVSIPPELGQGPSCTPNFSPEESLMYQHWKDHFFYVLSCDNAPSAPWNTPPPCTTSDSLEVSGVSYAAILIFAGVPINDGQWERVGPPDVADAEDRKNEITRYLEGQNVNNYIELSGRGDYSNSDFTPPVSGSGYNDVLYCIRNNVSFDVIYPCN